MQHFAFIENMKMDMMLKMHCVAWFGHTVVHFQRQTLFNSSTFNDKTVSLYKFKIKEVKLKQLLLKLQIILLSVY